VAVLSEERAFAVREGQHNGSYLVFAAQAIYPHRTRSAKSVCKGRKETGKLRERKLPRAGAPSGESPLGRESSRKCSAKGSAISHFDVNAQRHATLFVTETSKT